MSVNGVEHLWNDVVDAPTRALLGRRKVPPFHGKRPVGWLGSGHAAIVRSKYTPGEFERMIRDQFDGVWKATGEEIARHYLDVLRNGESR